MFASIHTFGRKLALLHAALLFVMCGSAQVQAGTISNTASARWTQAGVDLSAQSNTVSFDVAAIQTGAQASISVLSSVAGTSAASLTAGSCGGKTLPMVQVDAAALGATDGSSLASISIGQPVIFRIVVPRETLNPGTVDTVTVTLTSMSGDSETVTVAESGADTGLFYGALPTSAIPPQPVTGDCRLSVSAGDKVTLDFHGSAGSGLVAHTVVDVLADPFGIVFDSEDGSPVDGARVTLVNAADGRPARVFADDGVTSWPSSIITGQDVIDAAGNVWPMHHGGYRFPLAALGTYRLKVEPPAPYTAPSQLTPRQFEGLTRPDGGELAILPASFGEALTLATPEAIRVDIPVDRPAVAVTLAKVASRQIAQPGDAVLYTVTVRNTDAARAKRGVVVTDRPSSALRLRQTSVRIDGKTAPDGTVTTDADGQTLTITLGNIAAGASRVVTYAMTVRPDATAGQAVNRVEAIDARGLSATASAAVRVERDNLTATMTLIGRISAGECTVTGARRGIAGVRVVLEDGSFAVTDAEGRYHFEGLMPGTHVVEAQDSTLPAGGQFVDCARSTRSAGSATSRFITGQGGSLVTADFAAVVPESTADTGSIAPAQVEDTTGRIAAGAETEWLELGDGPTDFLFPTVDHNPRAPTVRVVIRHRKGQSVDLRVDGKPVDKLAFDGARIAPAGYAVSIWRGIPLTGDDTVLDAQVRNADGSLAQALHRTVHFGATPARVEVVAEKSHLVADGQTRPMVAVRVLDRAGRPVHAGISGPITLSAPYESAQALDAMQTRVLSGLDRAQPTWTVKGDDGIALIELAPTMVSGGLDLTFQFNDRDVKRQQVLEAWIVPGAQKWTLVGLAEGAIGAKSIADNMQRSADFDSDLGDHARIALYAKGRILGKFLTTLAYDSAKQRDEQRLLGGLDPKAYYTVFADGSDRRFDAASMNKLYLRIESDKVRALYGDFAIGFSHSQLGRYERTVTGVKVQARAGQLRAEGFAANVATSHRRDQIPGGGITGPYRLSSRAMVANSETVTIEVRDRFRSEIVVSSQSLTRFVDYDIDLLSGTITFKQPVLSRTADLNPQTIVVDYEIDTLRGGELNAGVRAEWRNADETLRIGGTAITDKGDGARTDLAAVDAKLLIGTTTELRAEAAVSHATGEDAKSAWLIEAERHDQKLDLLAYVRSLDADFGLGQASTGELGHRKFGVDASYSLNEAWSVGTTAWYDDSLTDTSHRDAVQLRTIWKMPSTEARLAISRYGESRADGTGGATTLIEAGATRRLFDNRLELNASAGFALGGSDESSYQPPRYRLGARYALTPDVRLISDYEVAKGRFTAADGTTTASDTRTLRAGLEVAPWTGARLVGTLGQQAISEQGKRAFAAYGLAQSLPIDAHLTLDASIDGNRVVGGRGFATTTSTATVGASTSSTVAEDFTAYTFGATWREGRWTATARAELRDGDVARRRGVTLGVIRQLAEGTVIGGVATWTNAEETTGATSKVANVALSLAHRPANDPLAFLAKVELRDDTVTDAVAGNASGTALSVDGDARSRRLLGSISADWAPLGRDDEALVQRTEIGLFAAARHNLDRYDGLDIAGSTLMGGIDMRIGLGDRFELGGTATVRKGLSDGTAAFAFGPQLGVAPASNVFVVFGYNITGFRDRDFAAARSTQKGASVQIRMKFDSNSLGFLGARQ
ncbi:isopeptide-forming domain-containing fimbrial protein [Novosphingobium sp. SL115]|uniref:isopeptide-forming domain-containing fimbrial protein n=1 Tax=Novosphingobium sp. SL115 TaxID=2995150 RepID=UPI00227480A3|nr:isopeptide-forming domain-containing fimbrial protein [Novosphingobium sp. SL115]MCY1673103.1 isopeptide-forming domain-containing fimbrial protein [Novosphingobium sp. SL115]